MLTGSVPAAFSLPAHNRLLLNFEYHWQTDDNGLRWIMKCLKHRWACKSFFFFLGFPSDIKLMSLTLFYTNIPHTWYLCSPTVELSHSSVFGKESLPDRCSTQSPGGASPPWNIYWKEVIWEVNLQQSSQPWSQRACLRIPYAALNPIGEFEV